MKLGTVALIAQPVTNPAVSVWPLSTPRKNKILPSLLQNYSNQLI